MVELVRASSSSQTQDESDSRAFFFCVLSVERCQLSKEEALGTVRRPCAMTENRRKIDRKSMKNRFQFRPCAVWALGAGSGTHRDALGTASELQVGPFWPPSWPSWPPCWRFGAPSWQSRAPSWPSWVASGPLSIALPARTLLRAAFEASFRPMLGPSQQARSLKFVRPRSVS